MCHPIQDMEKPPTAIFDVAPTSPLPKNFSPDELSQRAPEMRFQNLATQTRRPSELGYSSVGSEGIYQWLEANASASESYTWGTPSDTDHKDLINLLQLELRNQDAPLYDVEQEHSFLDNQRQQAFDSLNPPNYQ